MWLSKADEIITAGPEGPGAPTSPSLPGAPCEQKHYPNQLSAASYFFIIIIENLFSSGLEFHVCIQVLTTAPVAPPGPLSPGLPPSPCSKEHIYICYLKILHQLPFYTLV